MSQMTNEEHQFIEMCVRHEWPEDLATAWVYCHRLHSTPFPSSFWTEEMVLDGAQAVMQVYQTACQSRALRDERKSTLKTYVGNAAIGIGLGVLTALFTGRR